MATDPAPPSGTPPEDEESTPPVPVSHPANRPLLTIVSNLTLEAREHSRRLEQLYDELRTIQVPAPPGWAGKLLEEFERHHERTGENVEELRGYVGK